MHVPLMCMDIKIQANVNIPGISESTIRRKIQNMDFTADAQIQVYT